MRRVALLLVLVACNDSDRSAPKKSSGEKIVVATPTPDASPGVTIRAEQVKPPLDIKTPPRDAIKTGTGLVYKKLKENPSGATPTRNDTVLINYTGWRPVTGETFFTNRSQGQPMPLSLATTAPGFAEAMQILHKGETVMLWMPPSIGFAGSADKQEELAYELELVDIVRAPPIPSDFKTPPADALTTKRGVKYVVVKAGGGSEKARPADTVVFDYTGWDETGRMFDSTEMRKRPASVPPFRQSTVMEDILTTAAKGDRLRFWTDAAAMTVGGQVSGLPTGQLCYEVEIASITRATSAPPPAPADVAAPPATAKQTAGGVWYRKLKTGHGARPQPSDNVTVAYTGWSTDGRMFDSSFLGGHPVDMDLTKVIKGWVEAMSVMAVGDKARFWIPETLAYKDTPGRPQGMLVFDIELLAVKPVKGDASVTQPAPPKDFAKAPSDVAAPPKDAKKSPKGVFYKILEHGKKGGRHATSTDVIRVNYTGWTTDGKMFDSSVPSGQASEFALTSVIPGWTDAFPLLVPGDKARFWVPEGLAYQGMDDSPKGMLVFDVELLEVKPRQ